MDIFIIIVLVVAAVILFLVELFIVPGISIAGFWQAVASLCQLLCIYQYRNNSRIHHTCRICHSLCWLADMVYAFQNFRQDSLEKNITSKIDRSAEEKVKIGDTGVTTTRLALIGYAEINGDIVEVKSTDGFLNEKTPIIVNRITDGVILVEKKK